MDVFLVPEDALEHVIEPGGIKFFGHGIASFAPTTGAERHFALVTVTKVTVAAHALH
jgi:hypothetical protein